MPKKYLRVLRGMSLSVATSVILGSAFVPAIYFYDKYNEVQAMMSQETYAATENQEILHNLREVLELPSEEPTVATISDSDRLKDQQFFANAQNGDKVLIFPNAGKSVLYRPDSRKIIEMASLEDESIDKDNNTPTEESEKSVSNNTTPTEASVASSDESTSEDPLESLGSPLKIAIYNGSKIIGLTRKVEEKLISETQNISVLAKKDAVLDYEETIVVNLSASDEVANRVANLVNGKISVMSQGEASPSADILIIAGENWTE